MHHQKPQYWKWNNSAGHSILFGTRESIINKVSLDTLIFPVVIMLTITVKYYGRRHSEICILSAEAISVGFDREAWLMPAGRSDEMKCLYSLVGDFE